MRVTLFGATDLTQAVAEAMDSVGLSPCALVRLPETFSISYARDGVHNTRYVDLGQWSEERKVPVFVYDGSNQTLAAFLRDTGSDFALVAGWYHMVSRGIRDLFPRGCVGIHASLLPKFRGGAPLNWALLAGEQETGATMYELGDGIDDGRIYGQERFAIEPRAYVGDIVELSREASVRLVKKLLPQIAAGTLSPQEQEGAPIYALQRCPEDGAIDWRRSASEIELLVRATSRPYPGAYTCLGDSKTLVWRARALSGAEAPTVYGQPGQIACLPGMDEAVAICGSGLLALEEVADGNDKPLTEASRAWNNRRFAVSLR